MAKPLKTGNDAFIVVGFNILIDAVEKQERVEPKPLNSGLGQKNAEFDGLHLDEGFLIFSANADHAHHEQRIEILSGGGENKKLQSLSQSIPEGLRDLLAKCVDNKSMFCWDKDHQYWSKLGTQPATSQQFSDTNFVEFGQSIKQGSVHYGFLISLRASDIGGERLSAVHSTGLSILSKLSDQKKSEENTAQKRSILTAGERRVMLWCGNGKTSFEISRILGLSEHTVNHYIASAVRKLDATNRTHAIAKALKMNIVDLSEIN